jgi:hypothetical protein
VFTVAMLGVGLLIALYAIGLSGIRAELFAMAFLFVASRL